MQVTGDVTTGAMIVRVLGNSELCLENYQTLVEYTDERIRVVGKHMEICIAGVGMRIEYYGTVDMKVVGTIQKIEFV